MLIVRISNRELKDAMASNTARPKPSASGISNRESKVELLSRGIIEPEDFEHLNIEN
jgi:hypothetical protein